MKLLLRALVLASLLAAIATSSAAAQIGVDCFSPQRTTCNAPWHANDVRIEWSVAAPFAPASGCVNETINWDTRGTERGCVAIAPGGESTSRSVTLRVDRTAPLLTGAAPERPPDGGGWYRSAVVVRFSGADETSGILACTTTTYGGPDAGAASVSGVCRDNAGNTSAVGGFPLKYDTTPPAVTGIAPARQPDHGVWYTAPVGFAVSANDGLSGLANCDPLAYGGPASAAAVVQPICRDVAGNVGSGSFTFPFDATPPALGKVKVRAGDGVVRLNWAAADAEKVRIVRSPGRNGDERTELHDGGGTSLTDGRVRNGRRYEYRLSAVDQAGNESARIVKVVPGPRLISPANGARVDRPPVLRWTPVRGADYYNVQLWRGKRKVLSAWPSRARLELKRAWRYLGKRRLQPGVEYRWLVWPGEGPRALNDYGRLIGRRTFVFAPST
jgi:hypothetical protein